MDLAAEDDRERPAYLAASGTLNALLLDDSEFDRRRIRRLSRQTDLPIALGEVASIDALPGMLEREDFDVILLDFVLPEGDGLEALEIVRRNGRNAGCPVIMVAGGEEPQVALRALREGCTDYIAKQELNARRLQAAILTALDAARSPRERAGDIRGATRRAMEDHACALQPELARLVRDMRSLRAGAGRSGAEMAAGLEELEKRCLALWTLLKTPVEPDRRLS